MNAIATTGQPAMRPQGLAYADLERLAASIAASGLFGIKTKDQAVALMMIAHAEGRHPALAARDYDIIQNRPAKKSEAMLRDFLEGGGTVKWHALNDTEADATFSHPAGGSVRINWNMERATKAGLTSKENYRKFPRQMLRSRTVSEGVRTVYPLATSGMYVPEEVSDIPPGPAFAGPTLEATPEPPVTPTSTTDPVQPLPPKMSIRAWLDELQAECEAATTQEEANGILGRQQVMEADERLPEAAAARLRGIRAATLSRLWPRVPASEEDGEYTDAEAAKVMG